MRNARIFALFFLLIAICADAAAGWLDLGGKKKEKEKIEVQQRAEAAKKTEDELRELQKRYKDLEIDRDNVLAQTKQLLADRSKFSEVQEKSTSLESTVKTMMSQKDKLLAENQKLKKELASVVENHDRLKENFQELQIREDAEREEIEGLRKHLAGRIETSPQYLLVQGEVKNARRENEILKKAVADLDAKLKKTLEHIRKIQDRDDRYVQQLRQLKNAADALKGQNRELLQTNRGLNQAIDRAPEQVTELAGQNERLIKETAQMHYNMGVFFTENKTFDRAVKEFERALELDPNDQRAHYNLGYLYAEQFGRHEDAMTHFKKFLELDPESKQAEAVKSYLVMHHTYQGKSLEKGSGNPF